jgi:hypothetical protein
MPVRSGLVIAAAVALALSAWTAWDGRVRLEIAGVTLLRNSSVLRPLVVAAVLIAVSARAVASHAIAIAALTLVLPLGGYADTLKRLSSLDRPMRSLRDCAGMLPAARPETHAYLSSYYELLDHTPYYYLRQLGPWIEHESPMSNNELDLRLYEARQPTLVIMKTNEYLTIGRQLVERELPTPRGLVLSDNFVLATLGRLEPCFDAAVAGGGIAAHDWRANQSNR